MPEREYLRRLLRQAHTSEDKYQDTAAYPWLCRLTDRIQARLNRATKEAP